MAYFTTRKVLLAIPYELKVEEKDKIYAFLSLLEDSGVGTIIQKHVKNETNVGGRPNVNYYNLLAAIIFGFGFGNPSLRGIANSCGYDLRFIYIMEGETPSYRTIENFINQVFLPEKECIFGMMTLAIAKSIGEDSNEAFVDGSKFEANANKYKFVWKPTTFHQRISATTSGIIESNNLIEGYIPEKLIRSSTIAKALTCLDEKKEKINEDTYKKLEKSLSSILSKCLEYECKEKICGEGRKSYYKTDHSATAMCLKRDYYSGLGSNMHAAYNVQILVSGGLIMSYLVTQSRADISDFIGVIDAFHEMYGFYPKDICADSGYGSLTNYRYLKEHGIGNYVKHQSWEGNASGSYPDSYTYVGDKKIKCLWGKFGVPLEIAGRNPKKKDGVFYEIKGCNKCPFFGYCKRFQSNQEKERKVFEVVEEFEEFKNEAFANLLSVKGIEMRVNRSIQVEGAFGFGKQDQAYDRIRRRGLENVSAEFALSFLGMNLKKFYTHLSSPNTAPFYWRAPNDLKASSFPKPSAKRLSKKGNKVNTKMVEGIKKAEQTKSVHKPKLKISGDEKRTVLT